MLLTLIGGSVSVNRKNLTLHTDVLPDLISGLLRQALLVHHFLLHVLPRHLGSDHKNSHEETDSRNILLNNKVKVEEEGDHQTNPNCTEAGIPHDSMSRMRGRMSTAGQVYLVQFVHCGTDGAELVIRNTTHSKHTVQDASVIDL